MTHVFLHKNITSGMQSFVHYTSAKDNITVAQYLKDSLQTLFFDCITVTPYNEKKTKKAKICFETKMQRLKNISNFLIEDWKVLTNSLFHLILITPIIIYHIITSITCYPISSTQFCVRTVQFHIALSSSLYRTASEATRNSDWSIWKVPRWRCEMNQMMNFNILLHSINVSDTVLYQKTFKERNQ